MELKLKHLSAYLPYGLRMIKNNFIGNLICIKLPTENSIVDYFEFKVSCSNWWENTIDDPNPYKPILRPISDLTKEITVNGETFVPIYRLIKEDKAFTIDFIDVFGYEELKVPVYELLLEWHFDIFGLIHAGLAIDINTLNK